LNLSTVATVSYANASTVTVFEEDGATLLCFVVETAIERRGLTLHLSVDNSQATMSNRSATENGASKLCARLQTLFFYFR